eukprot:15476504-Alexandrium_andersonii.AAC.1
MKAKIIDAASEAKFQQISKGQLDVVRYTAIVQGMVMVLTTRPGQSRATKAAQFRVCLGRATNIGATINMLCPAACSGPKCCSASLAGPLGVSR